MAERDFFQRLRDKITKKINEEAFNSKECWEWTGCKKAPDGKYKRVTFILNGAKHTVGANRASYDSLQRKAAP